MYRCLLALILLGGLLSNATAQSAVIRGNVYDDQSGDPIPFAAVQLSGTGLGATTDESGFFALTNVPAGTWNLQISYLGYAPTDTTLRVEDGLIYYRRISLAPTAVDLETVDISARRERARSTVNMSVRRLEPAEIAILPSISGEPDIAQYLTVLPGIVSSGDQGGQLFVRGGAPSQTRVLLDGLTIYNPFHSIGLFSVFESEAIQSVDVLTGGFQADHGGRLSAVLDIKTRTGNKKDWHGLVSASPFQARALIEGPIVPSTDEKPNSVSVLLTGKYGYLDKTSPILYPYAAERAILANEGPSDESAGLPFSYGDLYGKISFSGNTGSELDVFGLHFTDAFSVPDIASLHWQVSGGGANFRLVPPNANVVVDGVVGYTDYLTTLEEEGAGPRTSGVVSYTAQLHFTYFGARSELRYGLDFHGFNTDFNFNNPLGQAVQQRDFTSEIAGYARYQVRTGSWILEPGLRIHYYAAQSQLSPEPRLGVKFLASDRMRVKAAGGLYSQNVLGTTNEEDVVNFFVGFLAGPQQQLAQPDGSTGSNNLQRAFHGLLGWEYDLTDRLQIRAEGYYKGFQQLINLNRSKERGSDPDFLVETGRAYGAELTAEYRSSSWYLWAAYALAWTERDDGSQIYPTVYDRRHNLNLLGAYSWGDRKAWRASARWNLGSPFPFTQTVGFYQDIPPRDLLRGQSVLTGNFPLGVLLSDERNGGRLSAYHRLDLSVQRTFFLNDSGASRLAMSASISNVYDRPNIFYVDRVTNDRVDQLPILPSLNVTFHW